MSSPSSGQKIESPVSVSPMMIGQLIELRPRCLGSSDGWYWIVPCVGMSRKAFGTTSVTKAITCRSGARARNSSRTAGSRYDSGWHTGSPAASAASFRGSGLPPGRSGAA